MSVPTRDAETEALFAPQSVIAYASAVAVEHIADLWAEEESAISQMVLARQAEFATARACARAALREFGVDAAIARQEGGAPLWPAGMVGSISHTRGYCVAIASQRHQSVGIDVEEIARMKPSIERRILVDAERARLDEMADNDRRRHVATVFAAKEAFYKAHYEIAPRYLGFDAVTVTQSGATLKFAPASGAVDSALLERSSGRVRVHDGRVIVGVLISDTVA